jgi:hypothetical protein
MELSLIFLISEPAKEDGIILTQVGLKKYNKM